MERRCTKCASVLTPGGKKCWYCGTKMATGIIEIERYIRVVNPPEDWRTKFCGLCMARLPNGEVHPAKMLVFQVSLN